MDVTLFRKSVVFFAIFAILIMMMTNFSYGNESTSVATGVETELAPVQTFEEIEISPESIDMEDESGLADDESIEI